MSDPVSRTGHLILTRRQEEAVVFWLDGQVVTVRVAGIERGRVTLLVEAPVDVNVVREELMQP